MQVGGKQRQGGGGHGGRDCRGEQQSSRERRGAKDGPRWTRHKRVGASKRETRDQRQRQGSEAQCGEGEGQFSRAKKKKETAPGDNACALF